MSSMRSVSIDFVAGSHGNFLEYVCNRFIVGHEIDYLPFNNLGASHINIRKNNFSFSARHFSLLNLPKQKSVVKISFTGDDLLLLSSGCFLRAGDSNIDVRLLEINTFNKLSNGFFNSVVDQINTSYSEHVYLSNSTPDCPRHILREFFKFGFKTPELNGLLTDLNKFSYQQGANVFEFKFEYFYDTKMFVQELSKLAQWYNKPLDTDGLKELHCDFMSRQIFRNDKIQCDMLIDSISNKQIVTIPSLSVLQESYINGNLENLYQIEMPFMQEKYFNSTHDISQYLSKAI